MTKRIGVAATILLGFALALSAQQNMYKIRLKLNATVVSLDTPNLIEGKYVFHAWPNGELTSLPAAAVSGITPVTGQRNDTVYQIELNPSGVVIARDAPVLKGNAYQFHSWMHGTFMSLRQSDVKRINVVTGDHAFWIEQGLEGETPIDNLALQGTNKMVEIGTPTRQDQTAQAGPSSLSSMNGSYSGPSGISGAPVYGNWSYQGTPGVSDAWSPANANMNNGVPTMPAATRGMNPPTMPR
jgi:hypothetical protein